VETLPFPSNVKVDLDARTVTIADTTYQLAPRGGDGYVVTHPLTGQKSGFSLAPAQQGERWMVIPDSNDGPHAAGLMWVEYCELHRIDPRPRR
jgi:hypothetical protein